MKRTHCDRVNKYICPVRMRCFMYLQEKGMMSNSILMLIECKCYADDSIMQLNNTTIRYSHHTITKRLFFHTEPESLKNGRLSICLRYHNDSFRYLGYAVYERIQSF